MPRELLQRPPEPGVSIVGRDVACRSQHEQPGGVAGMGDDQALATADQGSMQDDVKIDGAGTPASAAATTELVLGLLEDRENLPCRKCCVKRRDGIQKGLLATRSTNRWGLEQSARSEIPNASESRNPSRRIRDHRLPTTEIAAETDQTLRNHPRNLWV